MQFLLSFVIPLPIVVGWFDGLLTCHAVLVYHSCSAVCMLPVLQHLEVEAGRACDGLATRVASGPQDMAALRHLHEE